MKIYFLDLNKIYIKFKIIGMHSKPIMSIKRPLKRNINTGKYENNLYGTTLITL